MALVEVDDVAVDRALFERAKGGDAEAKGELKKQLDGLVLYFHALTFMPAEDSEIVTVRQLEDAGIVVAVTLHTKRIPS